ncbi:glutaminyl-tRNA synthetase [Desulfurella acetivorans A63]|nr:glutaminyl-tRNA synthetase [Desulfurella acetivorans A63]
MDKSFEASNFIEEIIIKDLQDGRFNYVQTRFPPEPNGYLHIGHAKAIVINFEIAKKFGGKCNLRFDDTNPTKENIDYINAIIDDVKWLGYDFGDKVYYASDYFDEMYELAKKLIEKGKAYVCNQSTEEIRRNRGTLTQPGIDSPYRNRSIEENLDLFEKMKNGEFKEGECVLRAKIDMSHPNLNMRDPVMYRIIKTPHHRTKGKWCIYPTYDWAHGLEDSIEKVTHSLCTLEFEDHRILYDWFLDELGVFHPRQIEFARLNLTYTVLSKRKLLHLVENGYVNGWDDPRMPTIKGLKRRGFTRDSIVDFIKTIGVTKSNSIVDYALLEHCARQDLNKKAKRAMVVQDPIKLIIENYPDDKVEYLEAVNNPEDESYGKRLVSFSKELFIERNDFAIDPPKGFYRLKVGQEVRLVFAYYVVCTGYETDENGNVVTVRCTYDPNSKGGWSLDARKVKGTIHWVNAKDYLDIELRIYDKLFLKENPEETEEEKDFTSNLNPNSLVIKFAKAEKSLLEAKDFENFQFLRLGYFCKDPDSTKNHLIFNKTVDLKDSYSKILKKS